MLLTHTHWDHIQGLPFFGPIYDSRCRLRILGCEGARKGLVAALTGQMESTYFPVPFDTLPSNIEIQELKDFNVDIGPVLVPAEPGPAARRRWSLFLAFQAIPGAAPPPGVAIPLH